MEGKINEKEVLNGNTTSHNDEKKNDDIDDYETKASKKRRRVEQNFEESLILDKSNDSDGKKGNQDHHHQDDCIIQEGDLKDDYLSALRSGEWRMYYLLYHTTDGSRNLHQIENSFLNNGETRDAPPPPSSSSNNLFMSRHLIAMARYFIQGGGLNNLYKILQRSLGSNSGCQCLMFDRINLDVLQSITCIFHTISFISSYCVDNRTQNNIDSLKGSFVNNVSQDFKGIPGIFLKESILRIHSFTQHEQRKLLEMIRTLEEQSLTSIEYTRLSESATYLSSTFSPCLNFNSKEAHEVKLSALWILLTGRNPGEDVRNSSTTSTTPSLQCQISALNEINNWIRNVEGTVLSY